MKTLKPVEEDDFTSDFSKEIASADKESASQRQIFDVIHSPNHHAEFISVVNSWQSGLTDCFFAISSFK